MVCETHGERRRAATPGDVETRGALWSLPCGQRLPNLVEGDPLVVGDLDHPARLLASDLEDPQNFHARLTDWLLRQD